jgi:hypothetical protein
MPITAITTKSSTNEKPFRLDVSIKSPFFTERSATGRVGPRLSGDQSAGGSKPMSCNA